MKNSIEIRQRAELIGKADALLTAKLVVTLTSKPYDNVMENIDKLAKDVEVVERQEKLNAEIAASSFSDSNVADSKEVRQYSFIDAAKAATSGRVEGLIREMDQEARSKTKSRV